MNKRNLIRAGGAAALSLALVALPGFSAKKQVEKQKIRRSAPTVIELDEPEVIELPGVTDIEQDDVRILIDGDGTGWLGVETHEVTTEKAKELKLPAERGVVLGKIVPDSPAAKAGLKENDVVTEINGQRVEGAAQYRRMVHEIPAGRSIQLTIWRDGRSQTLSATLGKSEERHRSMKMLAPTPGTFTFRMPDMPEIPDIPSMEWNGGVLAGGHPRLGIDAEDLNGQLGAFFGAPDGEGILVREVNSGSPAEKAGVKAGDVITSLNGERIRSVGELREKLSGKRDEKDRTVKLGVLRNKNAMTLRLNCLSKPRVPSALYRAAPTSDVSRSTKVPRPGRGTFSFHIGRHGRKLRVECGVMTVVLLRLIQRRSLSFHPRMRRHFFVFFPDADAQLRGDPLPHQKPPERQRFCQTRRMYQASPVRNTNHVRGQGRAPVCFGGVLRRTAIRNESFQHRLRPAKPAPTQTHRYDGQENDRAQKQALRRALQRPKSPEPFPH